jgi:hypothetical protein
MAVSAVPPALRANLVKAGSGSSLERTRAAGHVQSGAPAPGRAVRPVALRKGQQTPQMLRGGRPGVDKHCHAVPIDPRSPTYRAPVPASASARPFATVDRSGSDEEDERAALLSDSQAISDMKTAITAANEVGMRSLLTEHTQELKTEIHAEVDDKLDSAATLDQVLSSLASTTSVIFAAPVPERATWVSYAILVALVFSQAVQGVLTYKLYRNAKAPDLSILREFCLQGYLNLEEGYGRQNYTSFQELVDERGEHAAHSNWGIVPDGVNYTSCWKADATAAGPNIVGPCRLAMADDLSKIYDYQLYSVFTGRVITVDLSTLPVCVTDAGITNGFLNLFVGMFFILMTVTKEFVEVMTARFTVFVAPDEDDGRRTLSLQQVLTHSWVLGQIFFETALLIVLLYASFRQMVTVANDIWSVIETSVSVFFVTQVDEWVHYCLMSHPLMQDLKQLLSIQASAGRPARIIARHMTIAVGGSNDVIPADEVRRTVMVHGIGVSVPVKAIFRDFAEEAAAGGSSSGRRDADPNLLKLNLFSQVSKAGTMGRAELIQAFETFDTNGDGVLSISELQRGMSRLGINVSKKTLQLMDQDGNGEIDYREFLDLAVAGWEDDSDEAMVRLTDKVALRQIFVRFGEFNVGTVRRRSAPASDRAKFDAEGTPYGDTLENGRLDTSWALVTMGEESAAQYAVATSPLEVADGVLVQITPYDPQAAAKSRGGMQQVLARHQWTDTGRTVLVPLEWIRSHADVNGFALWHYFLELCVGHFCMLIMGGRLATFAELSCSLEAPWEASASFWESTTAVDRQGVIKGYNWYIVFGAALGKGGGLAALLYLCYNDCRNKVKGHIPDHVRKPSGHVQVPCWMQIALTYSCGLVLVEVFSPRPHIVDWLYGDPWRRDVDEAENRDLVGWAVVAVACFFLLVVVPNSNLWESLEETRTGVFPKQSLMIDGAVFSKETVMELQKQAADQARERTTGSRLRAVTNF